VQWKNRKQGIGGIGVIYIYTEKKESPDWILKNDLFFNLNTSNEEMTEKEMRIIYQADDAILTSDKHIEKRHTAFSLL